jgi:divalent metal cation (Fe/Co/Zn/Cd) transporter
VRIAAVGPGLLLWTKGGSALRPRGHHHGYKRFPESTRSTDRRLPTICFRSSTPVRMAPVDAAANRHRLIVDATRWTALSVAWALLVAVASLAAGFAANSTALIGFGLSSLVDGTASSILVRRFRYERLALRPADELERRSALAIGVLLLLIAAYLAVRASSALAGRSGPEPSTLGVVLTGASMVVLPVLARAKLRLAEPLESQALRADGILSGAGAFLAAATLMGLLLDAALHWWWADSVAALAIAAVLIREGTLTLRSVR